jgi:predicted peptidase
LGHFGNGEADLPLLLSDGIPALLDTKKFPANINVKGQNFSFLVLAPQFRTYVSNTDIQAVIDFAKTTYRIDSTRIYVSGFSLGGRAVADFGAYHTSTIAAIVPMAGASTWEVDLKGQLIATGKLPVWAFHNEEDQLISVNETKNFVAAINSHAPAIAAKLTLFPSSLAILKHDAWTTACDPAYRENGMNIYEWMLQFKK